MIHNKREILELNPQSARSKRRPYTPPQLVELAGKSAAHNPGSGSDAGTVNFSAS